MKDDPLRLGREGEAIAESFLRRQGFNILEKNFRIRSAEIDLIAKDGDTLVFVEVKTRRSSAFGSPAESITRKKQIQISKAALAYIDIHKLHNMPARFDVLAIIWPSEKEKPQVEIIPNAFELCYGR